MSPPANDSVISASGHTSVEPGVASSKAPVPTKLYFGYGSNLWLAQMRMRCPAATYVGLARLPGYRWIINGRGYANVVEIKSKGTVKHRRDNSGHKRKNSAAKAGEDHTNEVWGMVYTLTPSDEVRLDVNEGVPESYTKEMLEVEYWECKLPTSFADTPVLLESTQAPSIPCLNVSKPPVSKSMLVYIDRKRIKEDKPKKEYVHRMNMGIRDALKAGVPEGYVDGVMRKFIAPGVDEKEKKRALRQAAMFVDEMEEIEDTPHKSIEV